MTDDDPGTLDQKILEAHSKADPYELADLYRRASRLKQRAGEHDAAGFLLVHAYVFALESGHPSADSICRELVADGRELNE